MECMFGVSMIAKATQLALAQTAVVGSHSWAGPCAGPALGNVSEEGQAI